MSDTNHRVPQPQQAYETFDKKKAKVSSVALIVLGCVSFIVFCLVPVIFLFLWFPLILLYGVMCGFFGVFYFPIPIAAGILGILSSKQPSNGKVVAFMVLSLISAIFAALMTLICIALTAFYWRSGVPGVLPIAGIIGIVFYVALTSVGIYCSVLSVNFALAVPEPQETYEAFDKKKAKVSSIAILVLGCVIMSMAMFWLVRFGLFGTLALHGILASPIPIVSGALGIISSKQPSKGNIVAFKVLSIISVIIAALTMLICIFYIQPFFNFWHLSRGHSDPVAIVGIFFSVTVAILSLYCSVLCCKQIGCCSSKNQETESVVLGQIYQSGAPGVQNMYL